MGQCNLNNISKKLDNSVNGYVEDVKEQAHAAGIPDCSVYMEDGEIYADEFAIAGLVVVLYKREYPKTYDFVRVIRIDFETFEVRAVYGVYERRQRYKASTIAEVFNINIDF